MKVSGKLHQKNVSEKTKPGQRDGASARIQKEELEKEETIFVGVPAGILTVLLVPLAAFLVAVHRPSFRKEAGLSFLHLQPIACTSLAPGSA